MEKKKLVTKMCFTAVMLALSTVLGFVKIWQMPMGGSVTLLSMLPVICVSIAYGTGWGILSAFLYSCIQLSLGLGEMLSWGLTPAALIGSIMLDYILAFTVLGLAGLFRKKGVKGIILGVVISVSLRFLCHFISGVIIFGVFSQSADWLYSLTYNGTYMLPELAFTVIGAVAVFGNRQIKKMFDLN